MIKDRGTNLVELESLSSDMFSPLSERDASLVIGGADIYFASYKLVSVEVWGIVDESGFTPILEIDTYKLFDVGVIYDV
ncbi:MAG TPA: hypothetical protein VFE05_09505 [Longimicrobiaceae bacterium]|jgi:hypothetical protein|nr:hypothetical protein [Longimicrobiaceae bacterium]